ncbi:hypothetical protein Tco_0269964 [Tanacetum coccineum]
MPVLRLGLPCLKGVVTYRGQVDSTISKPERETTGMWLLTSSLMKALMSLRNSFLKARQYTIGQMQEDLEGDDLLLHDAEMEVMNMILLSIPNEIYNSVDGCTSTKDMWKRVERLMRGTIQNKVDRETCFTNEFDQFVADPEEALQLRNTGLCFRAKKLEKSHDPLALVANTGSSSRQTSSYYVTPPTSVVDYDNEYQHDDVHNNSEDPLVSAMLLLIKAITQNFSNPTNNRLRASSNTRNQAIIQGDSVNIQSRNSGNTRRNIRRAYVQEEVVEGMNAPNETGNVQKTLRTQSQQYFNCQCIKTVVEKDIMLGIVQSQGFVTRSCKKLKNFSCKHMLNGPENSAAVIISDDGPSSVDAILKLCEFIQGEVLIVGSGVSVSVEKDTHVPDLCAIEKLARNAYQEAEKQQIFAQQVRKQNTHLTSQLEMYKEGVSDFGMH